MSLLEMQFGEKDSYTREEITEATLAITIYVQTTHYTIRW